MSYGTFTPLNHYKIASISLSTEESKVLTNPEMCENYGVHRECLKFLDGRTPGLTADKYCSCSLVRPGGGSSTKRRRPRLHGPPLKNATRSARPAQWYLSHGLNSNHPHPGRTHPRSGVGIGEGGSVSPLQIAKALKSVAMRRRTEGWAYLVSGLGWPAILAWSLQVKHHSP